MCRVRCSRSRAGRAAVAGPAARRRRAACGDVTCERAVPRATVSRPSRHVTRRHTRSEIRRRGCRANPELITPSSYAPREYTYGARTADPTSQKCPHTIFLGLCRLRAEGCPPTAPARAADVAAGSHAAGARPHVRGEQRERQTPSVRPAGLAERVGETRGAAGGEPGRSGIFPSFSRFCAGIARLVRAVT